MTERRKNGLAAPSRLRAEAEELSGSLPPLLVEAERLSSATSLGVHGRRRAGIGETFWQFRRYGQGDAASTIDWRQSARSQHLFVREREWEAAEAVWFWRDGSPGMRFSSDPGLSTKLDRASLLALALASLLVRGGERIARLGDGCMPAGGQVAVKRLACELAEGTPHEAALPPDTPVQKSAQLVWLSDFLSPYADIERAMRRLAGAGFAGHLVRIVDPVEEDFPYRGRTRFEWGAVNRSEVFGRAEHIREDYCGRFRAHSDAVRALARTLGWSYLAHRTSDRPVTALIALYAELAGLFLDDAGMQAHTR